jgi:hypothetical protein
VLLGLLAAFWSAVLLGAAAPVAAFWSVEVVLAGGFAVVELCEAAL